MHALHACGVSCVACEGILCFAGYDWGRVRPRRLRLCRAGAWAWERGADAWPLTKAAADLAPVLKQRVKEADSVQQLLESALLRLLGEVLVRVAEVGDVEVSLHASRRFGGHLDRVLQDGDWEAVGGHRSEP